MIQFSNVFKRYHNRDALKALTLRVEPGELVFLTGHSGAGKSTLLRLVALLDRPTKGHVVVHDRNLSGLKAKDIPYYRRDIGMIFQDHQLLLDRSVFDNVALPLVIRGMPHQDLKRRVQAALDKVDLLQHAKKKPDWLSGGEQQRVGIARAIVNRPKILLADEPTGNLDPELSAEIFRFFLTLNELGMSTLIATHDLALIEPFKKRTITLEQGQVINDKAAN